MFINVISVNSNYKHSSYHAPINKNFTGRILTFDEISEKIENNDIDSIKNIKDFYIVNKKLDTLLHTAARQNRPEIVRFLLNKKLNPNQKNIHGKTPFAIACSRQNKSLVEAFLPYKPNVNIQDNLKNTPLHFCINSPEITQLLLDNKANPYLYNDFGQTSFANSFLYPKTLEIYLKNNINPNTVNLNTQTLMHEAIIKNRLDIADLLKKYKADVNYKDKWGKSAIFYSTNTETLDWLIKNNANINITDKNKQTVLHQSVIKNNLKFTNELLKRKANPNIKDKEELSPLAYAKTVNMMKLLLHYGSTPDIKTPNGKYLLHNCAKSNNIEAVNLLTLYKANPNVYDSDGNCPLDLANNKDIKILLLAAGSNPNFKTYLIDALKAQDSEFVDLLLECGANPDKIDIKGNSSIFYIQNESDLLKLKEHNVNLNIYNNAGYTPMQHFALLGRNDLVEILQSNGAQNLKSLNNETLEDCNKKFETYSKWIKKGNATTSFKGRAYYEYGTKDLRENLNYKTKLTTDKIDEIIENAPDLNSGLTQAYKALNEEEKKLYTAMESLGPIIKHFNIMIKDDINKIVGENPAGSKIPIIGIIRQYEDTVLSDNFIQKIQSEATKIKEDYETIINIYYGKNISELISNYNHLNKYLNDGIAYVNYVKGENNTRKRLLINLENKFNRCAKNKEKFVNNLNKTSKKYENLINKIVNIQNDKQNLRTARKTAIKIITLGVS